MDISCRRQLPGRLELRGGAFGGVEDAMYGLGRRYSDGRSKERTHWRALRKEKEAGLPGMGAPEAKDLVTKGSLGRTKKNNKGKGNNKGAGNALWMRRMRKERCHYCGEPGGTVDHVVPLSEGGENNQDNAVPACAPCNNFRQSQPYGRFKKVGWLERLVTE